MSTLVIEIDISKLMELNVVTKVFQFAMDTGLVTCGNLLRDHNRQMNCVLRVQYSMHFHNALSNFGQSRHYLDMRRYSPVWQIVHHKHMQ